MGTANLGRTIRLLGSLGLGLALLALLVGCRARVEQPNLLMIGVDTLRVDALSQPDSPTPTLDRLMEQGTVFEQAITPLPRTTPALASLLTGLYPHRHGSREVGDAIEDGVYTLAERLRDQGYTTLAVVANATAGEAQGLDRGFDHFISVQDIAEAYGDRLLVDTAIPPDLSVDRKKLVGWGEATTDEALRLLGSEKLTKPFFLWVFYFDPHFLYRPLDRDSASSAPRCHELYEGMASREMPLGAYFADVDGIASAAVEDCRRLYQAEVAYTDRQISRLLEALETLGEADRTFVVFTSDHGENFGEQGLYFEHGDNLHDAGLRVPLIFRGPGVAAGRRDLSSASLIDAVPTVLSLLELPAPAKTDGRDLSARLREGNAPKGPVGISFAESGGVLFVESVRHVATGRRGRICVNGLGHTRCEYPKESPPRVAYFDHLADPLLRRPLEQVDPSVARRLAEAQRAWPAESARQRTARTHRFKLVEVPILEGGFTSRLVDLDADPAESMDVSEEFPEERARLEAALARWTANVSKMQTFERDPEIERTLKSLGYLD